MRICCVMLLVCLVFASKTLFCEEVFEDFQAAESQDVVVTIDMLIDVTEKHLVCQKEIKKLLVQYKEVEKQVILDPDNTDNLLKLMKLAKELHESIKKSYLEEYFPPQFLQELDKLTALYDKKNILPVK